MALINALLWPLLTRIALPLTILTFGLGSLVLSAGMVALAFYVVDGKTPVVRRRPRDRLRAGARLDARSRRCSTSTATRASCASSAGAGAPRAASNRSDVPGVILFEIDGLGEGVLREAIATGTRRRSRAGSRDGSHRLIGWECDLSSQTGASQAGLLLGSNWDMPAFRWYEKESGRTMVSNHPGDAAELERRHSTGAGLLAADGTSRGQHVLRRRAALHGDDERDPRPQPLARRRTCSPTSPTPTASCARSRSRSPTSSKSAGPRAASAAAAPRTSSAGGLYPLIRASIAVVMRDLMTALLMADIVEGVAVSYATFVGYDEVAHHSGIREPDALAVLRRHDRPARAPGARGRAGAAPLPPRRALRPRPDAGRAVPPALRADARGARATRRSRSGDVYAPAAIDEAWGDVGAVLADARQEPSVGGRVLARATRSRSVEGTVALGPNREALAERERPAEARAGGDRAAPPAASA